MATLQKIRNHGVALLVIVGLAMLAFILGDFLNSGSSFFNRSREYVGTIAGHKVHITDYEAAKKQLEDVYKIESGNSTVDEEIATNIRNQVWNVMLMDWSLRAEAEKIGMDVTNEELSDLCIGNNPSQLVSNRPFFLDHGQFSSKNLILFHQQIFSNATAENEEQAAGLEQYKQYWLYWENAVRLERLQEKYTNLLQNLITANNIEAKYQFLANQTSVDAQYVMQPYTAVADSTIEVKEADLKKLYDQRKKLYKQTPNRSIEYICFAKVPSEDDFKQVEEELTAIEQDFQTTEDLASVVNLHSDIKYIEFDLSEAEIPAAYKEFAFGKDAKKDAFMGLTLDNDTYRMARLVKCGYSMPDSVKLRQIIAGQDEEKQPEAQWCTPNLLPQALADKAFSAKVGEPFSIEGYDSVQFECVEQTKAVPQVRIAIVERKVTPSTRTNSTLYNQAKQFIVSNPNEMLFRESAEKEGLRLNPAFSLTKNQDNVGQLKQSRSIVRWAFEAKEGDISDVFECGDQFVVALLSEVSDGEYKSLNEVEGELRQIVIRNNKAKQMIENLSKATTLEEAAQIANAPVQTAEAIALSDVRFGNSGMEPAVVGAAFATEAGKLSAPVKGEQGVYVLIPGQQLVAEGEEDDAALIQQMNMRNAYYIKYQAIQLVQDQAEIEDNRSNFQ